MPTENVARPYIVVSSDSHAGARWADYEPFIEAGYLEEFRGWLDAMNSQEVLVGGTRVAMRGETISRAFAAEPAVKEGGVAGAWDPVTRAREMDRDGVAGEVVFPDGINQNGVPFSGSGSLDPAANAYPFEARLAGCRAYNRWLGQLSAANPGRHACIAVVPFDDIDIAVEEITSARESGLFGGVLLPGLPLSTTDPTWLLHHPRYEPIWAACEDLQMPVNIHSTGSGIDYGELPGSRWIHTTEAYWTSRRPVWQLLWAGVLERHPGLKVAMTEVMGTWAAFDLQYWEYLYDARNPELIREALPLRPTEYWNRQCFVGASPPAGRLEIEARHIIGVEKLMWGSDYPHPDGAWPQSRRRIAEMFAGVPENETRMILGENALGVYAFDQATLREIADRVGISPSDIGDTPVEWEQPHKLAYVTGVTSIAAP